jgi:hypothetical protein
MGPPLETTFDWIAPFVAYPALSGVGYLLFLLS